MMSLLPVPAGGFFLVRTLAAPNSAPASVTTALGVVASLIICFAHVGPDGAAALTSLASAAGTLCVVVAGALAKKPVSMQLLTGIVTIVFTDMAVLGGHHWDAEQIGGLVAGVNVALGFILHVLHVTVTRAPEPAAAVPWSRGDTAAALAPEPGND
jgi:hypothetical protein